MQKEGGAAGDDRTDESAVRHEHNYQALEDAEGFGVFDHNLAKIILIFEATNFARLELGSDSMDAQQGRDEHHRIEACSDSVRVVGLRNELYAVFKGSVVAADDVKILDVFLLFFVEASVVTRNKEAMNSE